MNCCKAPFPTSGVVSCAHYLRIPLTTSHDKLTVTALLPPAPTRLVSVTSQYPPLPRIPFKFEERVDMVHLCNGLLNKPRCLRKGGNLSEASRRPTYCLAFRTIVVVRRVIVLYLGWGVGWGCSERAITRLAGECALIKFIPPRLTCNGYFVS